MARVKGRRLGPFREIASKGELVIAPKRRFFRTRLDAVLVNKFHPSDEMLTLASADDGWASLLDAEMNALALLPKSSHAWSRRTSRAFRQPFRTTVERHCGGGEFDSCGQPRAQKNFSDALQ